MLTLFAKRCVAQIATTFRDSKLMREAKSLYRESLRLLSSQMERINPKPNKAQLDDVIGALHALYVKPMSRTVDCD